MNSCRPTASAPFRATIATTHTRSANGMDYRVDYEPAESSTGLFGGNSNWRGPIWFPVNYLTHRVAAEVPFLSRRQIIKVECPTGSGQHDDSLGDRRRVIATLDPHLHCAIKTATARCSAARKSFRTTRIGATRSRSTNTSTATTAPASAPATRPAGPRWWQN